jgi:hypothetical protein
VWEIEYTDEFESWWDGLTPDQQEAVAERVELLRDSGPKTKRPVIGAIKNSRHDPHMKELVISSSGRHLRVLFCFDPRRVAILLIGGDKTGIWNRWYREMVPVADDLYDTHLQTLQDEGLI